MKKAAVVVVAVFSASLLLAGCSSQPLVHARHAPVALAKSTVAATEAPAFLSTAQVAADHLGSAVGGVRSDSTRYQGTVHGTMVYLGLDSGNNVVVIHQLGPGWTFGGSVGNTVFEAGLPDGTSVQYVPQGATAKTPAGWVPLSKYILVRKS